MNKIYVIKNSQKFGILVENGNDIIFTYDDKITKDSYIKGLDKKVNQSSILFPLFQNLLPEHHQLELLKQKHNISNQIDILLYLNNIHGSYEFYNDDTFASFIPSFHTVYEYNTVCDVLLESTYPFPNILNYHLNIDKEILFPEGLVYDKAMGLSGYQYKFSVDVDHQNQLVNYTQNDHGLYIMKPYNKSMSTYDRHNSDDYIPYLLLNEHFFMSFAREFGFKIPYNAIIYDGSEFHYIIKRYDRYNNAKFDHKEILTFMLKQSSEKYRVSMKDVLLEAKDNLDKSELEYLFRFIVYSIIIAHGDLHAKNLSLIEKKNTLEKQSFIVSPFYDISTTKIYRSLKTKDIGLKVGKRQHKITKEDICSLANAIDLPENVTEDIINETALLFATKFKQYVDLLPNEIKGLQFKKGGFGSFDPLEVVLNNYYDNRIEYITQSLKVQSVIQLVEDEKDIW